ncbi:epidermal retinol dehydrogenase 2 isoform X2 [Heterodontus francisci]|uniref:epidermal retinol dehydrogenase 2 isoform X2 n=1 Tax=Heterodontus francisci TaxID=7792 RepID=UPI00355B084D
MNFFLETLRMLFLSLYYTLEALVRLVVPVRRKNVSGEIVLVSGAGSGIGRLIALEFARLHATLVLWDVNEEGNNETARLARERGASRVHTYLCDCSKKTSVYEIADQTYKAFLPAMIASNHGHLVSIASSAGLFPVNGLADYCSSKFAAIGFAQSVALELLVSGKNGVKTTIVCPYYINTGMFDGCKTKWPHLLPILDPNYAAKKITDAILREQVILVMPRALYFMFAIKNMLPVKIGVLIGGYFGVFQTMDNFKGRVKKD